LTNLKLFNLTPLKRDYYVKGEVCDILAVDNNRQLVVLELKKMLRIDILFKEATLL